MKKKRNGNKVQRLINYVVPIVLIILWVTSYIKKQKALKLSNITTCRIVKKYQEPGRRIAKGKVTVVEYYVSGKRYECTVWKSCSSYNIGDCLLLEYSIKNPQISEILWDKGKQDCNCIE